MQRRLLPEVENFARIKVLGVGGGGSNAVNRMIQEGLQGVEFIAVNTDAQALMLSQAANRVRIGDKADQGPWLGRRAARWQQGSRRIERRAVRGHQRRRHGLYHRRHGRRHGTGAAPVIARIARETGALTIGVVTKPFAFEGHKRRIVSEEGIEKLKEHVDTLIAIPNDRLLQIVDRKASIQQAFRVADDVLRQGIQGISELITVPGLINLDFADVRSIMAEGGRH